MTLDELKAEAKKQGYRLVKIKPYIKLQPCQCGRKLLETWYGPDGVFYKCPQCGRKGEHGKTDREARAMWNMVVANDI